MKHCDICESAFDSDLPKIWGNYTCFACAQQTCDRCNVTYNLYEFLGCPECEECEKREQKERERLVDLYFNIQDFLRQKGHHASESRSTMSTYFDICRLSDHQATLAWYEKSILPSIVVGPEAGPEDIHIDTYDDFTEWYNEQDF